MSNPYVGEIRIFAGNFEISGWAFCNGQLLAISENDTLFNLIGTTYGGDGQTTFALPDLRGRVPIHQGTLGGQTFTQAQTLGAETVTLTSTTLPGHTHVPVASSTSATATDPTGKAWAPWAGKAYATPPTASTALVTTAAGPSTASGGSQPHENMAPSLGLNFIISLFGVYPSPS